MKSLFKNLKKKKKTEANLLNWRFSLLPLQLIHIIIRKNQVVQTGSFNPFGQIPLPNQPKNSFPQRSRRLPRISLQEILSESQFQNILPQEAQP
jgi:hypothetical protein